LKDKDCGEVKPMDEKHEVQDLSSASLDAEFEDHEQRKLLARAFASLHLLGLKRNAASLDQAIAQARRNAERYKDWKKGGTPIKDVVMRLSDGEEIEVKRTFVTGLCGFRFMRKFTPGEVIHLYKKADKQFDEVLLLSVNVDEIEVDGYVWENEYAGGQIVQLSVQPCADGQLHVSVDYTPTAGGKAKGAAAVLHSFIPGFAMLGNLSFGHRKTYRQSWQPSKGFAAILIGTVALFASLLFLKGEKDTVERLNYAPEGAKSESAKLPEETSRPDASMGQGTKSSPAGGAGHESSPYVDTRPAGQNARNSNANHGALLERASTEAGKTPEQSGVTADVCDVNLKPNRNSNASVPSKIAINRPKGKAPIPQSAIKAPDAIYIKAFVKDDRELTIAIEESFVDALRKKASFRVLTEADERNGIPTNAYWVDLWFSQKPGCTGTIKAVLRTGSNQIAWVGEKDCHKYPDGDLIERASLELVAEMMSEFEEAQKGD
jgi:hypothetical protein